MIIVFYDRKRLPPLQPPPASKAGRVSYPLGDGHYIPQPPCARPFRSLSRLEDNQLAGVQSGDAQHDFF